MGVLLSIVVMFLLIVFFWLLVNALWPLIMLIAVALFWVFNRALRQVFARSRQCKGNLAASLGYALVYTTLYTGWLMALIWLVKRVHRS